MAADVVTALILLVVVVVALAVAVVVLNGFTQQADSADRFPPISDAEFVARCRPGTSPAVALAVRRIVARNLGVEYARVHPSLSFVNEVS